MKTVAIPPRLLLGLVLLCGGTARPEEGREIPDLFTSSFAQEAKGQLDRATNDVLEVLRRAPDHYVANLRVGWLQYRRGRYGEAERFYRRAVALAPRAMEPRLGLLLPLMATAQWAEAERVARTLLKAAPHDYTSGSRLAWILYNQGRFEAAERQYASVLVDFPSDLEMRLGFGWTSVKLGKRDQAARAFRDVLEISADNVSARAGLDALD